MDIEFKLPHDYYVNGRKTRCVSDILRRLSKPKLNEWISKQGALFAKDFLSKIPVVNDNIVLTPSDVRKLTRGIKAAPDKIRDAAAVKGTLYHKHIEEYVRECIERDTCRLTQDQFSEDIREFANWAKEKNVKFLASEHRFYNDEYDYCGTIDIVAEVGGVLTIIDCKTSRSVHYEHAIQLAAYSMGWEREFFTRPGAVVIFHIGDHISQLYIAEEHRVMTETLFKTLCVMDSQLAEIESLDVFGGSFRPY